MHSGKEPIGVTFDLQSITERIDLGSLFSVEQPLEVELGSGDGSFLTAYAAAHPERNFIGIERLLGRVRKTERKARRAANAKASLPPMMRRLNSRVPGLIVPRGVPSSFANPDYPD